MPFVVGSIKQAKIGKTMLALGVLCITCSGSKKNHCSSFCKWILPNTMCQSPSMAFYHKPRSSEYLARMMIHCNKNNN